jgi:hypothetical protein
MPLGIEVSVKSSIETAVAGNRTGIRAIAFGFCLEQDAQTAKNAGSRRSVTGHDFSRADQVAKKIGL